MYKIRAGLFFISLFLTSSLLGQNLVPNYSFENYTTCPSGLSDFNYVVDWVNPSGSTPDYFNTCAPPGDMAHVPDCQFGWQWPRTGNGYPSIITYNNGGGWREYIQVQLDSTMIAGRDYCVEFYVCLGEEGNYAVDGVGAYISSSAPSTGGTSNLPYTPQVVAPGIITDTANWTLISGTYTASGGEQYVTIGNFNDAASTNASYVNGNAMFSNSYYFIEDVSVTLCSFCPPANLTGDSSICQGDTAMLVASGGNTYQWSTGDSTDTLQVVPNTTTTYTVQVIDSCNIDTLSHTVTVDPGPTANIAGPDTICQGDTATLTASGAPNYLWSTGSTTSSISVNPNSSTSYAVTVTNANSCSDDTSFALTVQSNPTPVINGDTLICPGDTALLTVTGSGSYLWSTGSTNDSIWVSPDSTTSFAVTSTNSNGCMADTNITVTVANIPAQNIMGDTAICEGDTSTLTATGGGTYQWSTGDMTASISVTPTTTTTYMVTVSNGSCSGIDTQDVQVNALPTPSISGPNQICEKDTASLTASGGVSYQWSTGDTTTTISTSPSDTTTYTVTATNANGCSQDTSFTLNVWPLPDVTLSGDTALCSGDTTTLQASGGAVYQWSTGSSSDTTQITPDSSGTYSVSVTSNLGCQVDTFMSVSVTPSPSASISGSTEICIGDTTTLTASGGNNYQWTTGDTSASITISPSSTQSYVVTVSNGNCTDLASETILVSNPPNISVSDTTICQGRVAQLSANGTSNPVWMTGDTSTTLTVQPDDTSQFWARITNKCGTAIDSGRVNVLPAPNTRAYPDTTITLGESVNIHAEGGTNYSWSPAIGLSCQNCASPVATPTQTTTYTVTSTNAKGCFNSDTVMVIIEEHCSDNNIFVPNAFSPDGDGENDELYVITSSFEVMTFRVFNRWGEEVFHTGSENAHWDGTYKGKKLDPQVFVYYLKAKCPVTGEVVFKKGDVTLFR